VVVVRVAAKYVGMHRSFLRRERAAQGPETRSRVEDDDVVAAPNLDTGGVAAISDRAGARAGDASADAPEPNLHML
jgi:hypothetical protein